MRKSERIDSTVPYGADQTLYLVVDAFGQQGAACQERAIERTDIEAVVTDLLSGTFPDPIRVVAFNTLEHWSSDLSIDIAREIQSRCDSDGAGVPQYLAGFMEIHIGSPRRFTRR